MKITDLLRNEEINNGNKRLLGTEDYFYFQIDLLVWKSNNWTYDEIQVEMAHTTPRSNKGQVDTQEENIGKTLRNIGFYTFPSSLIEIRVANFYEMLIWVG